MDMTIHPEAAKQLNSDASELAAKVREHPLPVGQKPSFKSDLHISVRLTERDIIGPLKTTERDWLGRTVARYVTTGNKRLGLANEFDHVREIIAKIQKMAWVRAHLSESFLEDTLFSWSLDRYSQQTSKQFIDYLTDKVGKAITNREVWIPLSNLIIECPFAIGDVHLRTITKGMIDKFESGASDAKPQSAAQIGRGLERVRKEYQGYAAAVVTVRAEQERAFELALQTAEAAVGLLRMYSLAAIEPQLICRTTILGAERNSETSALFVKDGRVVGIEKRIMDQPSTWELSTAQITEIRKIGLDDFAVLLREPAKTEFQAKVRDAILLYSKSTLTNDSSDKLVYQLTALESVFLKDRSEPIQLNLAERLAMVTKGTLEERKKVIQNIKRIYEMRSRYLHHGTTSTDWDLVRAFMITAYSGLQVAFENYKKFNRVAEFAQAIDDHKLSG